MVRSLTQRIDPLSKAPWLLAAALFLTVSGSAQKPAAKSAPRATVFAVLSDGTTIEPIISVENGKIPEKSDGDADAKKWADLHYKPKTTYPIVFGGAVDGSVTVIKSNIGTECGGSSANILLKPSNPKFRGMVMPLATDLKLNEGSSSYRRRPTAAERTEIEKLVRTEYSKHGVSAAPLKNLRYHNMTAVDLNGDDIAEFIGSYWIAPTKNERHLLFFIAEKGADEKLAFLVADYSHVESDDVMSLDLADVDNGIGNELLLDVLDIDHDGLKEIFTIRKAFEGNNFYVYKRADGKWTRIHEGYSYRCAY
jgi:hypothetical protein